MSGAGSGPLSCLSTLISSVILSRHLPGDIAGLDPLPRLQFTWTLPMWCLSIWRFNKQFRVCRARQSSRTPCISPRLNCLTKSTFSHPAVQASNLGMSCVSFFPPSISPALYSAFKTHPVFLSNSLFHSCYFHPLCCHPSPGFLQECLYPSLSL